MVATRRSGNTRLKRRPPTRRAPPTKAAEPARLDTRHIATSSPQTPQAASRQRRDHDGHSTADRAHDGQRVETGLRRPAYEGRRAAAGRPRAAARRPARGRWHTKAGAGKVGAAGAGVRRPLPSRYATGPTPKTGAPASPPDQGHQG